MVQGQNQMFANTWQIIKNQTVGKKIYIKIEESDNN